MSKKIARILLCIRNKSLKEKIVMVELNSAIHMMNVAFIMRKAALLRYGKDSPVKFLL